jgi:very-short-patch-repair endonuclease/endogenous inhibitor of DNA gyrase (YacG/DUF329 family)
MSSSYAVRTIVCKGCGKQVTRNMPEGRIFCSHKCYRESPRPDRKTGEDMPCALCGLPVYVHKKRLGNPRYFCTKDHADTWAGRNKTDHVCRVCDAPFRWSPSRTAGGDKIKYCSIKCRDADPEVRAQLLAMTAAQASRAPTSIEIVGCALLDVIGMPYLKQHLIAGKFCVDAFVPGLDIVVQFDGDYWHAHPERFPDPSPRQQRRARLDQSQDAYMGKLGYVVARVWECDLRKSPDNVLAALREFFKQRAEAMQLSAVGP